MHIAVAGNIGSGKTTLTGMLAKHYGWDALYESVDNNPYLASFYQDMQRWSFNIQVYFLNSRFRYTSLFELMSQFLQAPDLLIYLKADVSTLVTQIHKRGRAYEDSIRLSYLENLNEKYEKWISNYKEGKLLVVDVNTIKFAEKPEDFGEIINKIDAELFGLF